MSAAPHTVDTETPITNFTNCHSGIIKRLNALDELPALLFPAVIASAQAGEELSRVKAMTQRLTQEHRMVEALWKSLESGLKRVAKGQSTDLDVSAVQRLVSEYTAHAAYEEAEFLPLSEKILSRNSNHMAALGLSLHMRHAKPVNAYI